MVDLSKQITGWDQAEDMLKIIAMLDSRASKIRAEADEEINQVRGKLKVRIHNIETQRDQAVSLLEEFCEEHREDMLPQKSRKLRFGIIGFRKHVTFSWPKKNETLVKRLKELKKNDYIRIKEEPDKQGIMAHHEKLYLKALGVTRKVEEEFYYELNKEN
jgi:phage host-nuclease inhibitor protein Gam